MGFCYICIKKHSFLTPDAKFYCNPRRHFPTFILHPFLPFSPYQLRSLYNICTILVQYLYVYNCTSIVQLLYIYCTTTGVGPLKYRQSTLVKTGFGALKSRGRSARGLNGSFHSAFGIAAAHGSKPSCTVAYNDRNNLAINAKTRAVVLPYRRAEGVAQLVSH